LGNSHGQAEAQAAGGIDGHQIQTADFNAWKPVHADFGQGFLEVFADRF